MTNYKKFIHDNTEIFPQQFKFGSFIRTEHAEEACKLAVKDSKALELLDSVISLQKKLEMLINATPTGDNRNALTEENLITLELINSCGGGV